MKICAWSLSDKGRKRDHNEDGFLCEPKLGLYAVADGMGGHRGGARASSLALQVIHDEIVDAAGDMEESLTRLRGELRHHWQPPPDEDREDDTIRIRSDLMMEETAEIPFSFRLEQDVTVPGAVMELAARKASSAVFGAARRDPLLRGMGTTLTAMLHQAGRMYLVHAGDSRAYLFRDGVLRQLTEDHSWIHEQVKAGILTEEQARESEFRHVITRSIGFERDVEIDSSGIAVQAGDCFLLCSDGMSNFVPHAELERAMSEVWYCELPEHLVKLANERGGDDNITVLVLYAANHVGR
jgi:protein phosphatase